MNGKFLRTFLLLTAFIACVVLVVGGLSLLAMAANIYYVDYENGNDSNGGTSQASAWKYLPGTAGQNGAGWKQMQDGDVVYVKGGTSNPVQVGISSVWYNGAAKFNSIKIIGGQFIGWGSGMPIFDEQNNRTYGFGVGYGGSATGNVRGITIDGFEIKNIKPGGVGDWFDPSAGSACINVGGNGNVQYTSIRRCYLHDSNRDGDDKGHGIETGGGSYLIIENNTIGPNIGTKGIEIAVGTNWGIIRNNYVFNCGDHNVVISGDRWDVYNNVIRSKPPYVHDPSHALKIDGGQNNDVWNNLIFRDPAPADGNEAQGFGIFDMPNNRFYHNTIYGFTMTSNGCQYGTCISIGEEDNSAASSNDIQNNIAYRCINGFYNQNPGGYIQLWLLNTTSGNNIAFNNFYYQSGAENVVQVGPANCLFSNPGSLYNANGFNAGSLLNGNTSANNVQRAPNFIGEELPSGLDSNFHPNTGYFKLTLGTDISIRQTNNVLKGDSIHGYSSDPNKFAADILGNPRTACSMGAYEYVSGATPTPPSPPKNLGIR